MLKKAVSLIALMTVSFNLTACGSNSTDLTSVASQVQQPQQVQAQSFLGVYKEVKGASSVAFSEMDKNGDGGISPDEYDVTTADGQKSYAAIDKNHDGRITSQEMSAGFFGKIGLASRLKKAADGLFKINDRNKDKLLSKDEIQLGGLSTAFITYFEKYDVQKKTIFHKDAQGMLSQSEFENLYAYVSINNLRTAAPAPVTPAPAPATPTTPDQAGDDAIPTDDL